MTFEQQMADTRIREATYGFLAQAFRSAPTETMLQLLAEEGTDQAKVMGLESATDYVALRQDIEGDFNRVFMGMGPRALAAYESVYTSPEHLLMQDARDEVLACYRREGAEIATDENIPEDHIAFELGFMQHLAARTLAAADEGNTSEAQRLLEVQKAFYQDHLSVWAGSLCNDALARLKHPYYRQVCEALLALLEEEAVFFA